MFSPTKNDMFQYKQLIGNLLNGGANLLPSMKIKWGFAMRLRPLPQS